MINCIGVGRKIPERGCYGTDRDPTCRKCGFYKIKIRPLECNFPDGFYKFIEKQFQSMVKYEKKLQNQRRTIRPALKKNQQQIKRKYERKMKNWEKIKFDELLKISEESYQEAISSASQKKVEELESLSWSKTEFIGLKGKEKIHFNGFIFRCWYLVRKHVSPKPGEIQIHRWISNFLKSKGYTKDNRKPYTENDIKRIILEFEKQEYREPFEKLSDAVYALK